MMGCFVFFFPSGAGFSILSCPFVVLDLEFVPIFSPVPMGRWLHSGSSNMAVLEVPLFSGFRADIESLEQVRDGLGMGDWDGMGWGSLTGRGSLRGARGAH